MMIVRGRGAITTARRDTPIPTLGRRQPRHGGIIPMCWYCGGITGKLLMQPNGTLLHEACQEPAERDYPCRLACDGEMADAKVRWNDQRDREDDAGGFWA